MNSKNHMNEADLFTDGRKESKEAKKILETNGISYNEFRAGVDFIPEPGFIPPVLNAKAGQFRGLIGVNDFVIVCSLGKT